MEIANAYLHYAASFYSHIEDGISSEDELIARGLSFLDRDQFMELQAFLPGALNGGCTPAELQRAWMDSGSMICFTDRDLVVFLQLTVQFMDAEGYRSKRFRV